MPIAHEVGEQVDRQQCEERRDGGGRQEVGDAAMPLEPAGGSVRPARRRRLSGRASLDRGRSAVGSPAVEKSRKLRAALVRTTMVDVAQLARTAGGVLRRRWVRVCRRVRGTRVDVAETVASARLISHQCTSSRLPAAVFGGGITGAGAAGELVLTK